jgi:hypothetical protein
MVDRDRMGGFCESCTSNSNIVQQVGLQGIDPPCVVCGIFTTPAIWEGRLYTSAVRDVVNSYEITNGQVSSTPISASNHKVGYPGASPAVSSNGSQDGVVWIIDASSHGTKSGMLWQKWQDGIALEPTLPRSKKGPAVLYAYDASNLTGELWNSSQAPNNCDQAGDAVKFTVPTVANGRVYVGTQNELTVDGLLPTDDVTR